MSDTTEKFIKMCDTPEMQGREFYDGDWIFAKRAVWLIGAFNGPWDGNDQSCILDQEYKGGQLHRFGGGYEWEADYICDWKDATWLPRQEDLQKMVTARFFNEWEMVYHFSIFFDSEIERLYGTAKNCPAGDITLEQVWLAFVMHELHRKRWDDTAEQWVGK